MAGQTKADIRAERGAKRLRAYLSGECVLDTVRPWLVWEHPYYPAYYVPVDDVLAQLAPAGRADADDRLGECELFDVGAPSGTAAAAARRYPRAPIEALQDLVRIDWDSMDEWLEEDEAVYTHPRDPYHRVDVLDSSRHVRFELDGQLLAESRRPRILFETGLIPRYYLPLPDVRLELLRPSLTRTHCPYKGEASYWSVELDGAAHPDLVWCYRAPLAESAKIAGLACFYSEKVSFYLDGTLQTQQRPHPDAP